MILRKPYAFLIKYFRVIHLVITVLLCLVIYKGYGIYNFFNAYVQNNYTTSVTLGLASEYLPFTLYLEIIIILALVITIIILLVHKKKPNLIYFFMAIYYIGYTVFLVYLSVVFKNFEYSLLASTAARTLRDISLMVLAPQAIFIVYMGLRALGLNVKKFNFNKDLRELQLGDGDSDEVEININFETYKAKRNVRRFLRELVYYVKENKLIVGIIVVVLVAVGLYFSYSTSSTNFDNNYKVGSTFRYQNLDINIKECILSNLNYRGAVIKKGSYFLVLKVNIKNNYGESISFDYNNFKLNIGGVTIVPNNNYVTNFLDYNSTVIPKMYTPKIDKDVLIIYEINEKLINKKMKLQLYNGSTYKNGTYYDKNIYISIDPKKYDNVRIVGNYDINDEIKFENTFLGKSSFKPTGFSIDKNQTYTYTSCDEAGECKEYKDMITASMTSGRSGNSILLINGDLTLDKDTEYVQSFGTYSAFAEHFATIQYKIGDEIISNTAINVTPDVSGINFLAFEVPPEISDASVIQLIISIRENRYIFNILG